MTNEKLPRISASVDCEARNANGTFRLDEETVPQRRLSLYLRIRPDLQVQCEKQGFLAWKAQTGLVSGAGGGHVGGEGLVNEPTAWARS